MGIHSRGLEAEDFPRVEPMTRDKGVHVGQWEVGAFIKTNFYLEGNNKTLNETNRYLNQNNIKQRTHRKPK